MADAPEFFLISYPALDGSKSAAFDKVNSATRAGGVNLSSNYEFNVPDLRVGTLDQLMSLSDSLGRTDAQIESVVHRLFRDIREHARDTEPMVHDTPPFSYVSNDWAWDEAKYPLKSPLKDLVAMLSGQVEKIEADLKVKMTEYTGIRGAIQALERKTKGSLMVRALDDVVAEDMVVSSENLTTAFVVVPKHSYAEWEKSYETLVPKFVVPRTSLLVDDDADFGLFRVVLFRRALDDFRNKAREKRFTVRDFSFNREQIETDRAEREKLQDQIEGALGNLIRWCLLSYGEAFSAWVHLKAVRVFVESVLRYGLPANLGPPQFQAMLLLPEPKMTRRLRDALATVIKQIVPSAVDGEGDGGADEGDGAGGAQFGLSADYFPYVNLNIVVDQV